MKNLFTINKAIGLLLLFLTLAPSVQAQFPNRPGSGSIFDQGVRMRKDYERRKENGQNVNSYLRYHVSLGYSKSSGNFNHTFMGTDRTGKLTGKQSIDKDLVVNAWTAGAGTYFPLFNISEKSILAFNFNANGIVSNTKMGVIRVNEVTTYDFDFIHMDIGFPLSLDLKYGGEAVLDKTEKASFTLGVGICPSLYVSTFGPTSNFAFDTRPYIHFDIGFFAGIEWKIQASYLPGNTQILNLNPNSNGMTSMPLDSYITANKGSLFNIGIGLMVFSYDWGDGW